jgi:ribosomal protein S18 acetylase RimI-like enzyme
MKIEKYLEADKTLLAKLKKLIEESAQSNGFAAEIDLDTSMNAVKDMPAIFTYEDGEPLKALLFIFAPGREEVEVMALVHPAFRNKGIFRNLLREAADTALSYGYRKGLFICNGASASGISVIRHWGCGLDHAELQMSCETPIKSDCGSVEIVEAQAGDIEELSCIGAAAFERDGEFEKDIIMNSIASGNRTQYAAKHEGRMVGLCAACEDNGRMMIFGLGVHPGERRKGYARALLGYIAADALKKGIHELCLDVDADNPGAIALYKSFGFTAKGRTECYNFSLEAFK